MSNIAPINLQRRLVEVGRIRLGKKVDMGNGKSRPAKLDKFRLTSRDKRRLDAAALLYGGTVAAWEGEWELYTETDELPIAVVPNQALNVDYEQWGQITIKGKKSPVICLRRCDGVNAAIRNGENMELGSCLCAQEPDQSCRPTTRVSVILTEIPGLGVWRAESHGWNALNEMQGQVELLELLTRTGHPVRARLRADKRTKPSAGGTRNFVVPVIDIDHTVDQVLTAVGDAFTAPAAIDTTARVLQPPAAAIEAPADQAPAPARNEDITPVPPPATGAPSVAEQLARTAAGVDDGPAPRANAAQPIGSTGIEPRTVEQVAADNGGDFIDIDEAHEPEAEQSNTGGTMPPANAIAMWLTELTPDGEDDTAYRRRFLEAFSESAYTSAKDVPADQVRAVQATIYRLKRGAIRLAEIPGTGWRFRDAATGLPTNDPGGQSPARKGGPVDPDAHQEPEQAHEAHEANQDAPPTDEAGWRAAVANVDGIGPAKLLNQARKIAGEHGAPMPNGLDEIVDPDLGKALLEWLASR